MNVGDRVRPKLTTAGVLGSVSRLNPQPPCIGVVTKVVSGGEGPDTIYATFDVPGGSSANTVTVNASNIQAAGVTEDALDVITAPNAILRASIIDKMVVGLKTDLKTVYSSEYIGKVVDFYNVNGLATVLVLSDQGLYYELPFTRIQVVTNR
jgi:hypothetical protein